MGMKKIIAKEGYWITQKNVANENERLYSKEVWLADNDSAENWRVATDDEKQKWSTAEEERRKKMEEEMKLSK